MDPTLFKGNSCVRIKTESNCSLSHGRLADSTSCHVMSDPKSGLIRRTLIIYNTIQQYINCRTYYVLVSVLDTTIVPQTFGTLNLLFNYA